MGDMGVLGHESFHTSHICCTRFCLGEVTNSATREVLLQSSCGSNGRQMMFLSIFDAELLVYWTSTSGLDNTSDLMIGRCACEGTIIGG